MSASRMDAAEMRGGLTGVGYMHGRKHDIYVEEEVYMYDESMGECGSQWRGGRQMNI